ncbi:MAG: MBG domain-containing protein [Methylococcaceae bacterium]
MKTKQHYRLIKGQVAVYIAICAMGYSLEIIANPNGAQIMHGQVTVDNSTANLTTVTNSPNAIIQWQNFSIARQETTRFIQQNSQSTVLNRVVGGDPSEILGQLISNGKVLLINPAGIVFGANATVDTQGLIASSLNLNDTDFLAGNYHFIAGSDNAGSITNEGIIRAGKDGNIILIAPSITNNGTISSDHGQITLAAGQKLTLTSLDNPSLRFEVQAPSDKVLNLGELLTAGGAVNVFAHSIEHSGDINADSVQADAQGNIQLIAQQDIKLAQGSTLSANNNRGNAGTVTIQSETGTSTINGSISAQATVTGNGGVINTEGKIVNTTNSQINASAANGQAGEWKLSANKINIQQGDTENSNSTVINSSLLNKTLNNGTSVNINAVDTKGDIALNNFIAKTAGGNTQLTLNANRDINLTANIRAFKVNDTDPAVGKLDMAFNAGGQIAIRPVLKSITLDANGGSIDAANSSVTVDQNADAHYVNIVSPMTVAGLNILNNTTVNIGDTFNIEKAFNFSSGFLTGFGLLQTNSQAITTLASNNAFLATNWNNYGIVNINADSNTAGLNLSNLFTSQWNNYGTMNWHKLAGDFNNSVGGISLNNAGNLNIAGSQKNDNFEFKSGSFNNSGTLTINNALLTINPAVSLKQTGRIDISNTASLASSNDLTNEGIINNAGTIDVGLANLINKAVINSTADNNSVITGTVQQSDDASINVESNSHLQLNNSLTGTGQVTIAPTAHLALMRDSSQFTGTLSNQGVVELNSGSLSLNNAGLISGIFKLLSNTHLNFTGTAPEFSAAQAINGKGEVSFNNTNNLLLPAINAQTVQAISSANITQKGIISANSILLSAGGAYFNNVGKQAFNISDAGRWLVYSQNWQNSIENGLVAMAQTDRPRLYAMTYSNNAPTTIEAGNHFIYNAQPSVNIIADNKTKIYGDTDPSLSYQTQGLVNDDGVKDSANAYIIGALNRDAGENVNNYSIHAGTLAIQGGYTGSYTPANLAITPASLHIIADSKTKIYGDTEPSLTYSVNNNDFKFNDNKALITGQLSRESGQQVGQYNINQANLAAGNNYTINYTPAVFTIDKATLNIIANNQTKIYGDAEPSLTYNVNNNDFKFNDNKSLITGQLSRESGQQVGQYSINQSNLSAGRNYTLQYTPARLAIMPATLNIIATHQTKVYGDADPKLSYSSSGFKLNDTKSILTGQLSRELGQQVGQYNINQANLAAGNNYNILFTSAKLAITPATLQVIADAKVKNINTADPVLTYSAIGFKLNDNKTLMTGALARESGEQLGNYKIVQNTLAAGGNYQINYRPATLEVKSSTSPTSHDEHEILEGESQRDVVVASGQMPRMSRFDDDDDDDADIHSPSSPSGRDKDDGDSGMMKKSTRSQCK